MSEPGSPDKKKQKKNMILTDKGSESDPLQLTVEANIYGLNRSGYIRNMLDLRCSLVSFKQIKNEKKLAMKISFLVFLRKIGVKVLLKCILWHFFWRKPKF